MKRIRIISILMALALLASLLPAPAALAEDYWICPRCEKRVRESVGDICPYCGYERHVHDWTPATCVTPKTCTICGETEGEPDPANHEGAFLIRDAQEATCQAAGYSGDVCCEACGGVVEQGHTVPLLDHQWDEGQMVYPATCKLPGVTILTCMVCGATKDRVDPADSSRHTWDEGRVIYPATCVKLGLVHYACTGCGREKDETIPPDPDNHFNTELRGAKAATCAEAGYTGDTYCTDCGQLIQAGVALPATEHHDWLAATATAPKTCRVCGKIEGKPLPPAVTGMKTVTITTTSVTIGWDEMPGAEYYSVYQRKAGEQDWINKNTQVSDTHYTFTNLTRNTEYEFRVIVHSNGQQSNGMVLKQVKTKKNVMAGDIVTFGHYEQDNNKVNGLEAIEWQVLDVDEANSKALLISKYGLDAKPYNKEYKGAAWATCALREWLNKEFLETAFTEAEQKIIKMTKVDNSQNQGYKGWRPTDGENTRDRIFLLSYLESNRYYNVTRDNSLNIASRVTPTAYACTQGAGKLESYKTADGEAAGWWWLRSPSYDQNDATCVNPDGILGPSNVSIVLCVRPALWVNLQSGNF